MRRGDSEPRRSAWVAYSVGVRWIAPSLLTLVALSPLCLVVPGKLAALREPPTVGAVAATATPPPTDLAASSGVIPPTPPASPASAAPLDGPKLGIIGFATLVYEKPSESSKRVGYLRAGAIVGRSEEPVGHAGCKAGWYAIQPYGHVCAEKDATTDLEHPILRAATRRPRLDKPLPYRYGFVRATLPLYLKVPTSRQQYDAEMELEKHLDWYKQNKNEDAVTLGAMDLALDPQGRVLPGKRIGELGLEKNSTELSLGELFGGTSDDDPTPFWLEGDERAIPNISGFDVPASSVFADRARRHYGLAFVGSFQSDEHHLRRRFGVTTDLRLAPTSKVKPDSGSPWHGVELGAELDLPIAFVRTRGVQGYRVTGGSAEVDGTLERRSVHRLTGKVETVAGERYYALEDGRFARATDVGLAVAPSKWPKVAENGEKWIEVDLSEQVLVLWNGKQAEFATLVSTGRPAIGDPKDTYSTIRGQYRVYAKHVSATMDSDEGMGKKANSEKGLKPGDEGYVPAKGDGVYGVTLRRGHGLFTLRDVPHIQYFHKNYAIHGAYWHDVFGIARSHGCINLAPADSLRVFRWTTPTVPDGWHGVREEGTTIIVHK
ncbi:MAG: L,D-transpeptidase [Deltaproteobacteria bacterium]|nr:L,D-transpeptidase [Deltaproteobacteria bacterium]